MSKIIRRFRYEEKYECTHSTLLELAHRLRHILQPDAHASDHGIYTVRSLYFDDMQDSGCHSIDAGANMRRKYRVRMYNMDAGALFLEKKEKRDMLSHKTITPLSLEQYAQLLRPGTDRLLWETSNALIQELCRRICIELLRPKCVVEYRRQAFSDPSGSVRITMDTRVHASYQTSSFLKNSLHTFPVLDEGYHILEVKYTEALPCYIRQALQIAHIHPGALSKYLLGRRAISMFGR
ncbi:MAG: polyphosphate polymerase domain-containing protein [Christensenellales bacterium]|jgi:hypothetical protein